MSYPKEVQAIFDLTIDLLEKDKQFDRVLLAELRMLYTVGDWENEAAISGAIDHLVTPKESTDG